MVYCVKRESLTAEKGKTDVKVTNFFGHLRALIEDVAKKSSDHMFLRKIKQNKMAKTSERTRGGLYERQEMRNFAQILG